MFGWKIVNVSATVLKTFKSDAPKLPFKVRAAKVWCYGHGPFHNSYWLRRHRASLSGAMLDTPDEDVAFEIEIEEAAMERNREYQENLFSVPVMEVIEEDDEMAELDGIFSEHPDFQA